MPRKVEDIYQKKTQHEHILARPEMYIGPVQREEKEVWVFDDATSMMVRRKLSWVPGLYKIFDEILVNAADNKVRDFEGQTLLKVDIRQSDGLIRVYNNGEGIPVQIHKEHKLWVPEMIFGHLLTSSNYDDTEAKVTGGRNGFGAKLTNVFSRKFELVTVHRGKKFTGRWTQNMTKFDEPKIEDTEEDDHTMVSFWPDFPKFGMSELEDDIFHLMKRRVYDIAGTTHKTQKVKFNGTMLPLTTFTDLVDMYPTLGEDKKNSCSCRVPRWEVCIRVSNIGHQHVSFVNSIATMRGGKHVDYIIDQVVEKVIAAVKKKHKGMEPKPQMIRQHLFVFVNAQIENPTFDSQTKETLTTNKSKFGSTCDLPASMMDAILKSGIVERTVATANSKVEREMASKLRTSDRSRITGIPKLEDANDAGTKKGSDCTLILTEGDSAKALAVSGLSTIGRDKYGVFPLRGKPLNVRDVSMKKVLDTEEIQHIVKIMGLKVGTVYEDVSLLRYGRIMIMSDQDHDGSHIKGLIVNLVHHFWPQLLRVHGFLTHFITPIVKALPTSKGPAAPVPRSFFSLPDFLAWRAGLSVAEARRYTFKYYKGLGTSTAAEGREYFQDMTKHRITFVREQPEDEERIVMAFSKDRVEDRKRWITSFSAATFQQFDYTNKRMPYREFIDKELILFSVADCERSIPSIIDGLKPGQRKILYSCFKRNLTRSIKVAQLAGYVSEHSAYHHGEASLTATIVNLAQDFVGANNVPLLVPDGQYGTRSQGGKDSASARYIFTNLAPVTRAIFPKVDDYIVDYKDDDGFPVEPHFYVPVIPMVLVNGTSGIGTGFATNIPNFSPHEIIKNVRAMIAGNEPEPMKPWYYGFTGDIEANPTAEGKFITKGKVTVLDNGVVNVSELPVAYWTSVYKKNLEEMIEKELVVQFRENHTDVTVDFDIVLHPDVLHQWRTSGVLEEKLDLRGSLHTTNIIGFNQTEALTKYRNAENVMKEFFVVRLEYYGKRKEYLIKELNYTIEKLQNTVRFVNDVINGRLDVTKKRKAVLLSELRSKGFKPFPPQQKRNMSKGTTEDAAAAAAEGAGADTDDSPLGDLGRIDTTDKASETPEIEAAARDFDYLLGLRIWSLTLEMVQRLEKQLADARRELDILTAKQPTDLWVEDLDKLEAALSTYFKQREKDFRATAEKKKRKSAIDISRIKIPTVLGDKGRNILSKEAAKVAAKDPTKPKPKPKRRKRKGSDDEDGWFDSTDEDEDDMALMHVIKRKAAPKKSAAPKPAAKAAAPKPKRTIKKKDSDDDETSSVSSSDDDDDDDSIAAATRRPRKVTRAEGPKPAAKKSPAKKASPAKKSPAKPVVKPSGFSALYDSDDDLLLGVGGPPAPKAPAAAAAKKKKSPSPAKKAAAAPAAAKQKKRAQTVSSSDDDSDSEGWYNDSDSDDDDWDDDSDDSE